jgi:hypothetical protein
MTGMRRPLAIALLAAAFGTLLLRFAGDAGERGTAPDLAPARGPAGARTSAEHANDDRTPVALHAAPGRDGERSAPTGRDAEAPARAPAPAPAPTESSRASAATPPEPAAATPAVLVLRVLDERGLPLADERIVHRVPTAQGSSSGVARTDADGRLRIRGPGRAPDANRRALELELRSDIRGARVRIPDAFAARSRPEGAEAAKHAIGPGAPLGATATGAPLGATATGAPLGATATGAPQRATGAGGPPSESDADALPGVEEGSVAPARGVAPAASGRAAAPLVAPELDLGDVRLLALPRYVSGVVRNPAGLPVPGVTVWATTFRSLDGSRDRTLVSSHAGTITGADGAFAIHGWPDGATHVEVAATHRIAPEGAQAEVLLGTAGLELVLQGGGAIAGKVLTLDDRARRAVRFAVRRDGAQAWSGDVHAQPGGGVLLPELAAGTYAVRVRADGDEAPLLLLAGVEVTPGGRTRPPELDPLDLRGVLRRLEVHVVDGAGGPIAATVYARAAGAGVPWRRTEARTDAPAVLYLASEAVDVTVTADAHGWAERREASGAITLVCGPTYPVRVRLSAPAVVAEHHRPLFAQLVPRDHDGRSGMASESVPFDGDGIAVVRAKGSGLHDVRLSARGFIPLPPEAWRDGAPTVDVAAGAEVVVTVPPGAVEMGWESMQGLLGPGDIGD